MYRFTFYNITVLSMDLKNVGIMYSKGRQYIKKTLCEL